MKYKFAINFSDESKYSQVIDIDEIKVGKDDSKESYKDLVNNYKNEVISESNDDKVNSELAMETYRLENPSLDEDEEGKKEEESNSSDSSESEDTESSDSDNAEITELSSQVSELSSKIDKLLNELSNPPSQESISESDDSSSIFDDSSDDLDGKEYLNEDEETITEEFSIKSDIENTIKSYSNSPEIVSWLRSGSQILYKDTPLKFLGVDEKGDYRIAYLDRSTGNWIPKLVTHNEYSRLRNSKHKPFKYNFAIKFKLGF